MNGTHAGYGFPINGTVDHTYDDNIFNNIFGEIERGIYGAGDIIGNSLVMLQVVSVILLEMQLVYLLF